MADQLILQRVYVRYPAITIPALEGELGRYNVQVRTPKGRTRIVELRQIGWYHWRCVHVSGEGVVGEGASATEAMDQWYEKSRWAGE